MTESIATTARQESPTCSRGSSLLTDRRLWLVLGAIALMGGAALNWQWLVAAGLLPILFAALPCVAMCALHLCSRKSGEGKCGGATAKPASEQGTTRPEHAQPDTFV